ncbi:hypothetical protein BX600DRAFT_304347 [Xylariales sp. PMI_506]|nr:hypothetical protein BX600DRAFT_304347 [Xylariales sp. PMI_506]
MGSWWLFRPALSLPPPLQAVPFREAPSPQPASPSHLPPTPPKAFPFSEVYLNPSSHSTSFRIRLHRHNTQYKQLADRLLLATHFKSFLLTRTLFSKYTSSNSLLRDLVVGRTIPESLKTQTLLPRFPGKLEFMSIENLKTYGMFLHHRFHHSPALICHAPTPW